MEMLGEAMVDTEGVDGSGSGLGQLSLRTHLAVDKILRSTEARFSASTGVWAPLDGVCFDGYEIHHGRTAQVAGLPEAPAVLRDPAGAAIGWQQSAVLGWYAHGMFESSAVLQALFGALASTLDSVFDTLADFVERHFEPGVLPELIA